MNNVKIAGFYVAERNNTCSNKPTNIQSFGMVVVHNSTNDYIQELYDNNNKYRRRYTNNNWEDWKKITEFENDRMNIVTYPFVGNVFRFSDIDYEDDLENAYGVTISARDDMRTYEIKTAYGLTSTTIDTTGVVCSQSDFSKTIVGYDSIDLYINPKEELEDTITINTNAGIHLLQQSDGNMAAIRVENNVLNNGDRFMTKITPYGITMFTPIYTLNNEVEQAASYTDVTISLGENATVDTLTEYPFDYGVYFGIGGYCGLSPVGVTTIDHDETKLLHSNGGVTSIKTINGQSLLGEGDITFSEATKTSSGMMSSTDKTKLDAISMDVQGERLILKL